MNKRLKYLNNLADDQDEKAMTHWRKCKYCKVRKECKVYNRLVDLLSKTDELIWDIEHKKK